MEKTRNPVDSVGFPTEKVQVESFIERTKNLNQNQQNNINPNVAWKTAIVPHDDYAYVQELYPKTLAQVKARTIFMIGVAHKARLFNLQDKIVFGSFDYWNAPFGKVKVSRFRNIIKEELDSSLYVVNDSMQSMEHSLEPFLPILQYAHNDFEIIPILVPYMDFEKMQEIAEPLANIIFKIVKEHNMEWGRDFSILTSTDAVHYGDEDWGGKNFARFGTDSVGYEKAVAYEHEIIDSCFLGGLTVGKIERFTKYTVDAQNYKEYKWTWCGRYSVPLGLLTSYYLQDLYEIKLQDTFIGYSNSIAKPVLNLEDIGMGTTAVANMHHWVGYCAVGYY
jgi:AmmeMemoRadiSam system protein B